MKHFRAPDPSEPLPDYSGVYLTWETDSFVFDHCGLKLDVMLVIDCVGSDSGQFDPVEPWMHVKTADMDKPVKWPLRWGAHRRREFKDQQDGIVASLTEALEKRWDRDVEAELVEKAEEER